MLTKLYAGMSYFNLSDGNGSLLLFPFPLFRSSYFPLAKHFKSCDLIQLYGNSTPSRVQHVTANHFIMRKIIFL